MTEITAENITPEQAEVAERLKRLMLRINAIDPTDDDGVVQLLFRALMCEREVIAAAPLDMLLWCPNCGAQHVDAPDGDWTNPPHKSHLCHACKCIWRPADRPTNGVAATATRGSADTWDGTHKHQSSAAAAYEEAAILAEKWGNPRDGLPTAIRSLAASRLPQ